MNCPWYLSLASKTTRGQSVLSSAAVKLLSPESPKMHDRNFDLREIVWHRICSDLRSSEAVVASRGTVMSNLSHFETLTMRHVLIQERTKKLISELRCLVHLLDGNIHLAETRMQSCGIPSLDHFASARELKARRDNLIATIARLNDDWPRPHLHS